MCVRACMCAETSMEASSSGSACECVDDANWDIWKGWQPEKWGSQLTLCTQNHALTYTE